jgi:hypothetical protein
MIQISFFSHMYFLVHTEYGTKRNVPIDAMEVHRWSGDVNCQLNALADLPQGKDPGIYFLLERVSLSLI